jgi:hypothetical protein
MKKVLGITLASFAMATIAWGADNTLGTWKLNVEKSQFSSGTAFKSLTVTWEAVDGGVKITAKWEQASGANGHYVTTTKYDGNDYAVKGTAPWDTVAIKQIDANTLIEERSKTGGKYHSSVRIVVSKDTKTMTMTAKGTHTDGKSFNSVNIFDKQ